MNKDFNFYIRIKVIESLKKLKRIIYILYLLEYTNEHDRQYKRK